MTEPTMSSMTTYGSMDVSSVRVHGPITQDNHATTKLYVDQAAAAVRDGIVNGAGPALDTLKEIEVFLQGEPNVSAGLVTMVGSVQSQLGAEINRATGIELALRTDLNAERDLRMIQVQELHERVSTETEAREANVSAINAQTSNLAGRVDVLTDQHTTQQGLIEAEVQRATIVDQALGNALQSSVAAVNTRTDALLATKFDKSGGVLSGDLNLVGGLLYIGPNWRIVAVGQSLEFQFSANGGQNGWSTGIPFISV